MENRKYQYDGIIVGENIRRERLRLGLTTEQLAELVDKSARHINKVELGWSKLSIDLLYDLASALHTDANTLLEIKPKKSEISIDELLMEQEPEVRNYMMGIFVNMIKQYPAK
ncbi:MAG: helix-turn-helix transcriptional regulator [Lachnospiraceae bacterium]|nr:helix-turn-helix transcriptional regulator [Lachnospiraceae bacterium]